MTVVDRLSQDNFAPQRISQKEEISNSLKTSLVYCSRCGIQVGNKSVCTGSYSSHDLVKGNNADYCDRCGITVGNRTICTGSYTSHSFVERTSDQVYCSRCGKTPGDRAVCTGPYTAHDFQVF